MSSGIPWSVAVPPEVYTEYCGIAMSAYHASPAIQMDVQLRGPQILHDKFGLPCHRSVAPDFTTYLTASVFGLRFEVFADQVPAPRGHPIGSLEQAAALTVPADMRQAGYFPRALEYYHYMKAHAAAGVQVGFSGGSQAPFTTAVLLRGEGFLMDLIDRPDLAHRFLQTLTDSSIRQRELAYEVNGVIPPVAALGFSDDYGGLLGPDLYREFDVPYMLQIAQHFGAMSVSIHTELLRKPHLAILQDCGFASIDVGTDPYLTVTDCREVLHIPFLVQLKTSEEMLLSTPERIKQRYREMVDEGATRMLVELCRGVPGENVRAFIEAAEEFE